jgi:hypothetical protein
MSPLRASILHWIRHNPDKSLEEIGNALYNGDRPKKETIVKWAHRHVNVLVKNGLVIKKSITKDEKFIHYSMYIYEAISPEEQYKKCLDLLW